MNTEVCQTCDKQEKHEPATHWCVQCEEHFCVSCYEYHKVLKLTKDHHLVTADQYRSVSCILSVVPTTCEFHNDETLYLFCPIHNIACCNLCKHGDHANCDRIRKIEEFVLYEEHDNLSETVLSKIKKRSEVLEGTIDEQSKKLKHLDLCRDEYVCSMQKRRQEIEKVLRDIDIKLGHFDKEYQVKRLELQKQKQKAMKMSEKIKKREEGIRVLTILKATGNVHFFLAERYLLRQNEKDETEMKKFLESLSDVNCKFKIVFAFEDQSKAINIVDNLTFELKPGNYLKVDEPTSHDVDSSTVEADEELLKLTHTGIPLSTSEFSDKKNSILKWQCESNLHPQFKQISLNEKSFATKNRLGVFQYKCSFVVGNRNPDIAIHCAKILQNGNIILGDSSNRLSVFSKTGSKIGKLILKGSAESMVVVDKTTVAVSMAQCVVIVDVTNLSNMQIKKHITLSDNCYGITFIDNNLIVNCEHDGLKLVSLGGYIVYTHYFIKGVLNICAGVGKTVVCVKRDSEMVHFFNLATTNRSKVRCPNLFGATGIAKDLEGNVFVCCDYSNKVYMLPHGCTQWKCILGEEDKIDNPLNIAYDTNSDELIVINKYGKSVCVYQKSLQ